MRSYHFSAASKRQCARSQPAVATAWLKKVGDQVTEDEPLADVEAEKVEETLESPASGTLLEILIAEGDTVEVRTPVAVIETGE